MASGPYNGLMSVVLAMVLALFPQEDVAALVEALRSRRIEVREEAFGKLKGLGESALPALRKAASSKDLELSARAGLLVRDVAVGPQRWMYSEWGARVDGVQRVLSWPRRRTWTRLPSWPRSTTSSTAVDGGHLRVFAPLRRA